MKNNFVQKKKFGLALGSGGPKGLIHIGVIKELLKQGIRIDCIAGTSVGAWVGAHYALNMDIDSLEELTVQRRLSKLAALIDPTLKGGFVSGDKLQKLLGNWLKNKRFMDTKIPFKCVATDIIAGTEKIFSQGAIVQAVQASMAVPSLFRPVKIKDRFYVDGGIIDPVPDEVVRGMGADIVLAVNLDNCKTKKGFSVKNITSITNVATRSVEIMRHYLAQFGTVSADFIIQPQMKDHEPLIWKDYFLGKFGPELVQTGERETRKIIKDLIKKLS